jgi:hypothetical protein
MTKLSQRGIAKLSTRGIVKLSTRGIGIAKLSQRAEIEIVA